MSCPWIESRAKKDEEKTLKYGPMMWELKQRYNGYGVEQYNVIVDVLGGYSKHLEKSVRKLLGARERSVLERMQKSVISNTFFYFFIFIFYFIYASCSFTYYESYYVGGVSLWVSSVCWDTK